MSGARNEAKLDAIFGAQASGKSSLMKIETARSRPARLMIWDPKGEYDAFGQGVDDLRELVRGTWAKTFRLVFQPALSRKAMRVQFNVFCKAASQAKRVRLIVDELADVTEPNWAPEGWEIVTRQGRHAGLEIQGASQRPADVDKSFYGNATRIVVFRLNAEGDVDRMAKVLRVPRDQVTELRPLEYLERDMRSGVVTKKNLSAKDLARIPL